MKIVWALTLMILCVPLASAKDKHEYPLILEVRAYSSVTNGYSESPRQLNTIGNMTIATGGYSIPLHTMIDRAVLITPDGKLLCTIWSKHHYLLIGTFHARQINGSEVGVLIVTKKRKKKEWKFKIIAAEKWSSHVTAPRLPN